MPDVRMPDGTIIRNVPEGTTQSELQERLGRMDQGSVSTSGSPFGQMTASRFLGNVASVPDLVANLGARAVNKAAQPVQRVGEAAAALRTGDFGQFEENPQVIENVPDVGQEFVPGPEGEDLMATLQRAGEFAAAIKTGDFSQFQPGASENQRQRIEQMREENPVQSMLANISGDVLTLMTGRSPIASGRGRGQLLSRVRAERASSTAKPLNLAPNVSSALKRVTSQSKNTRTLLNRAGRAAETGLEGFALSALNGEADPLETFGFAAGTQASGSLLLGGMTSALSGNFSSAALKLAASAAGIGAMLQIFKESTPGGRDFSLESLESGFEKVALGLAAGTLSGLAGMGRVTSRFPVRAMPEVADAITSLPRSATLSLLTELQEDPASEAVVSRLATDPLYFDASARRRLERAMQNQDVSMSETIEDLMSNRSFREKFEALGN